MATGPTILGISAFYHDSAAALLVGGELVAAAQEERFTRKKNDAAFPAQAVAYCLAEAGLTAADVDYVGFYDKPLLKLDRQLETWLAFAPRGFWAFARAVPVIVQEKLFLRRRLDKGLAGAYRKRYVFTRHHEAHAASAFFPSPFDEAAILTMDGVGEWATASIGRGAGGRIELLRELRFPHSLGLLYSAFTQYCGFRVNNGEYKLMGLAPYGEPRFAETIRTRLATIRDDGSLRLDMRYFDYCTGRAMTNRRFHALFGGPPRRPESEISQRDMDLAASVQAVTEDVMLRMARTAHELTGARDLCLAGGVALNCVGNGRILREGPFDRVWVQPAAGDAGGALGVASYVHHQLLGRPRQPRTPDAMHAALVGPAITEDAAREALSEAGADFRVLAGDQLLDRVCELLDGGAVVGWAQGRMEFGPRALGDRSILADPRRADMKEVLNAKVKKREGFRPFAPAVLRERVHEWFDVPEGFDSPYMTIVAEVRPERRGALPAVTHVDGTARLQTVDARHGRFYELLKAWEARTGCPVLINTSFNVRGEPVVCDAADAWRCFTGTGIDALAVDELLVRKPSEAA